MHTYLLKINSKNYKHLTQVFLLAKIALIRMKRKISVNICSKCKCLSKTDMVE